MKSMCKVKSSVLFTVAITVSLVRICAEAQDQHNPHAFEVATVRPSLPKCVMPNYEVISQSGRLTIGCQTLLSLVRLAYFERPQEGNVTSDEKWTQTDRYDVVAKLDEIDMSGWIAKSDADQRAVVRPLLQKLLAQRFSLKVHSDTRTGTVYSLIQSKGGAKLKEVAMPRRSEAETPPDKTPPIGGFRIESGRMLARAEQIRTLLWFFAARSGYDDAPLVDKTGLTGYYDLEMDLPELKDQAEFGHQLDAQLGLRIERQRVPIPTMVIDGATRPSVN